VKGVSDLLNGTFNLSAIKYRMPDCGCRCDISILELFLFFLLSVAVWEFFKWYYPFMWKMGHPQGKALKGKRGKNKL
jgi:hypothetical protein